MPKAEYGLQALKSPRDSAAGLCFIRISRSRIRWTLPTPSSVRANRAFPAFPFGNPRSMRTSGRPCPQPSSGADFRAGRPEAPAPSGCAMSWSCEMGKDG